MGSRRTRPTAPVAAAVVSEPIVAPIYTPALQLKAWYTNGIVLARRPPKISALIGTPSGFSQSGSIEGHCEAGAVNRALGCAALRPVSRPISGVQRFPCQSSHSTGGSFVRPSHHTPPSGVSATFVKIVFLDNVAIAFGFVFADVPGATPKNPASGLIARSCPFLSGLIKAMSSPTVQTFQPSIPGGGIIIAKFVFPQALGNAAATYVFSPSGFSTPTISMCSAIQPSSRAMLEAMRKAKHFFPSSAFPPYPEPYDQISRVSGKWTIYFSLLHGHGTSFFPRASGAPTLWMQGTTRLMS